MSFDELKRASDFTDDLIHFALDQLRNNSLIEDYERNHFGGMNRREVVKRVALSTMIALPVIASLAAPSAASAASTSCTPGSDYSDFNNGIKGKGRFAYAVRTARITTACGSAIRHAEETLSEDSVANRAASAVRICKAALGTAHAKAFAANHQLPKITE